VVVSTAHIALPLLPVTPITLKLARQWNVRPELRADFDWLVSQPEAKNCRPRDLLEHLNLAALQRGQFAASLSENEWREFVLSPWIDGAGEDIAWRRELWETLYPRIRRETDPGQAATHIARQLSLRLRVYGEGEATFQPCLIWERGTATQSEFRLMSVAALRSIGLPARLNPDRTCEFFNGHDWLLAPRPLDPGQAGD